VRTWAGILAAAVLFVAIWPVVHPPLPLTPVADVYTSLSVARNLAEGEGLNNDLAYPLFTAYPWGDSFPQPLVHRPPGLAFLLVPVYWLAGGDPVRCEELVPSLMLVLMGGLVMAGLHGLRRRGVAYAGPAWLLLLMVSPLLGLAVSQGWSQIPAALLLLILWLMVTRRRASRQSHGAMAGYAAVAAGLALVRMDLLWVPVLWWVGSMVGSRRRPLSLLVRRTVLAAFVGVLLLAPWWIHVTRYMGSPLGNPLASAVQLDLTGNWWAYPLLRSCEPLPLGENLTANALAALKKTAIGIRFFLQTLGLWLPWLFWVLAISSWLERTVGRWRRGHAFGRAIGPPGLLVITLGLLMIQYGFFSQETRFLLVLMPVLAFEGVLLGDRLVRRLPRLGSALGRGSALVAVVALALLVTPPGLGGEAGNVTAIRSSVFRVEAVMGEAFDLPAGPIFSDTSVIPWRLGRECVWSPYDAAVEAEIRQRVPGMAEAAYLHIAEERYGMWP